MDSGNEDDVLVAYSAIIAACTASKKKRKRRKMWAKSWLMQRDTKSAFNMILQEFRLGDKDMFRNYLRMNTDTFDELARLVYPALQISYPLFHRTSVKEIYSLTYLYHTWGTFNKYVMLKIAILTHPPPCVTPCNVWN